MCRRAEGFYVPVCSAGARRSSERAGAGRGASGSSAATPETVSLAPKPARPAARPAPRLAARATAATTGRDALLPARTMKKSLPPVTGHHGGDLHAADARRARRGPRRRRGAERRGHARLPLHDRVHERGPAHRLGPAQGHLHLHPREALHDCERTLIDDDALNTRAPARLPTRPREARARPALPTPTPTPAPLPRQVALGGRGSTPPSARSSSPCPCCSRLLARRSLWTRTCRRSSSARARGSAAPSGVAAGTAGWERRQRCGCGLT